MGKTKLPSASTSKRDAASREARAINLEELIRQQGIKPVTDLDEIGALWPAEDDPKAFLAFLDAQRKARRQKAQKRKR